MDVTLSDRFLQDQKCEADREVKPGPVMQNTRQTTGYTLKGLLITEPHTFSIY